MSTIVKNENGNIEIKNQVIKMLILRHIILMDNMILPANPKGKILKKNLFATNKDLLQSIEIYGDTTHDIRIYLAIFERVGSNEVLHKIASIINNIYYELCLEQKKSVTIFIKQIILKNPIGDKKTKEVNMKMKKSLK